MEQELPASEVKQVLDNQRALAMCLVKYFSKHTIVGGCGPRKASRTSDSSKDVFECAGV